MPATNSPLTPEVCRTFVALERAKGVLKAVAADLGEATPTLSKRLRPLVVGAPPHLVRPWLRKVGKRFLLTEEGTAMLPAATDLADRWDRLVSDAERQRLPGLTVACGQEAAGGVVLTAAAAFRKAHPEAPLRIAVVRGRRRIEGVAGGQYDLALVTSQKAEIEAIARRKLAVRQLEEDKLVLACGAKSEWATEFEDGAAEVTAAQLKEWPFVLPETDAAVRQEWDDRLAKALPHPPAAVIEVGGWRVLLGYVVAGFGVGLLPTSVADGRKDLRTRPLADALRPRNHLRVVTLPTPANAALVADFAAALG